MSGIRRNARVVGVYWIPYCPELYAIEVIIRSPPYQVDFEGFPYYEPPAWDRRFGIGAAHFYLSEDGETLIGSYLGHDEPCSIQDLYTRGFFARSRKIITRAVMLVSDYVDGTVHSPWGPLRLPRETSMPERLLRLIWVDEGLPPQSDDVALGEDV